METEFFHLMNRKRNKKKKNDIPYTRVWSQKCSSHAVNIPKVMNRQDNEFNYQYSLLFSDNRDIKLNNPIYNKRKINNKKNPKFLSYISYISKKILNKAYNKMNFMKKETQELQKMNTLSIQKTSKTYFRTSRPKTSNYSCHSFRNRVESASTYLKSQGINLSNNNSKILKKNSLHNSLKNIIAKKVLSTGGTSDKNELNNIYSNENTKENTNANLNLFSNKRNLLNSFNKIKKINFFSLNKNKIHLKPNFNPKTPINLFVDKGEEKYRNLINIDIPKLYSLNKKKHLNLFRLNNEYRVQMNKSFHHYNAENHLKELNKIQKDNLSVRQSMENIKHKINQKINDRSKGLFFKKEYLKLKEENEKNKKDNPQIKKSFPDKIPFNIILKDKKNKKNEIPKGYKMRAYYDFCTTYKRIQNAKDNELLELGANLLLGHFHNRGYDLMYNSLDELFNSLDIEPIMKYIDKFKNEKAEKNKNLLTERIKNYFPALTESEKKIQKIEQHRISKGAKKIDETNILEKINETKKLLNHDN